MIVPTHKRRELRAESFRAKWHEDDPRTFILQTQHEPLHQGSAPVLANGAEARCDPLAITPILEHGAPELLALIADDVFRGGAGGVNGAIEEVRNR